MARYFFNVVDGRFFVDTEGTECQDMQAVRREAILAAGEMLRELPDASLNEPEWQMHVTDVNGLTVLKLTFAISEPRSTMA